MKLRRALEEKRLGQRLDPSYQWEVEEIDQPASVLVGWGDPDEVVTDEDIADYNRLLEEELHAASLDTVYHVRVSRRGSDRLPPDPELRTAVEAAFARFIARDLEEKQRPQGHITSFRAKE